MKTKQREITPTPSLVVFALVISLIGSPSRSASQISPPSSGLVGWWRGNGDAKDSSGHGHDGTVLNGAGFTTGLLAQAFNFGQGYNRVVVPDSPDFKLTNSLSIGAWVFPKANSWTVVQRSSANLVPYSLGMDGAGNMGLWLDTATLGDHLTAPITFNSWTHVAATWEAASGEMRLYFNGVLVAQKTTAIQPVADLNPTQNPGLAIGNEPSGNFPFIGLIEEVVLYDRALAPAEASALSIAPAAIVTQPQSQNIYSGSTLTLSVAATGSQLNYLWYKDGAPLFWATNSSLVISNASTLDTGVYTVIVSNLLGTIPSTPAKVSVANFSTSIGIYPGITISGITGSTVQVQYTMDVGPSENWTTLTNLILSASPDFWVDRSVELNSGISPRRFYRVVPLP